MQRVVGHRVWALGIGHAFNAKTKNGKVYFVDGRIADWADPLGFWSLMYSSLAGEITGRSEVANTIRHSGVRRWI